MRRPTNFVEAYQVFCEQFGPEDPARTPEEFRELLQAAGMRYPGAVSGASTEEEWEALFAATDQTGWYGNQDVTIEDVLKAISDHPGVRGPAQGGGKRMDPRYIQPLHCVRDPEKLRSLVESMKVRGWAGRPILALDAGDSPQALTGSHRIAAAVEAGLEEIPVYLIDTSTHITDAVGRCVVCGDECWVVEALDARDDEDRLAAIKRSGDKTAINLIGEEVEHETNIY